MVAPLLHGVWWPSINLPRLVHHLVNYEDCDDGDDDGDDPIQAASGHHHLWPNINLTHPMHNPGQPLLSRNRESSISKDTSKIHLLTVQPSQKLLWTTYLREQMQHIFSFQILKAMIEIETMQATLSSIRNTTWVFLEGFPLKAMSQLASWRAPCQTVRVFLIWRNEARRRQEELKLLQAHTRPWGCPSYALAPDLAKFLQGFYSEQFIVNPVLPATLDPTLQCDSYHNWCTQNCFFILNKDASL